MDSPAAGRKKRRRRTKTKIVYVHHKKAKRKATKSKKPPRAKRQAAPQQYLRLPGAVVGNNSVMQRPVSTPAGSRMYIPENRNTPDTSAQDKKLGNIYDLILAAQLQHNQRKGRDAPLPPIKTEKSRDSFEMKARQMIADAQQANAASKEVTDNLKAQNAASKAATEQLKNAALTGSMGSRRRRRSGSRSDSGGGGGGGGG